MSEQLTICFSSPASSPAAATSAAPVPGDAEVAPRKSERRVQVPDRALSPPSPRSAGLPTLRVSAGYEMYRDDTRTVIRKPGEARWGATVRTGSTTHRFVGAGADPAALWTLAGREAARSGVGAERGSGSTPA